MVKKIVKRGDKFRENKLVTSLKSVGVSSAVVSALVKSVKAYVAKSKKPTTLGIRRLVEKHLKSSNPAAYKKYASFKK